MLERPSVYTIVHTSRKVCFAHNSQSICMTDLKLQGYIIQGVNLSSWVFSSGQINIYGVMGLDFVKIWHF